MRVREACVPFVVWSGPVTHSSCFLLFLLFCANRLGPNLERMINKFEGVGDWPEFHLERRPYLEVFEKEKDQLVYLTSDSPNTLESLDPKCVYIIGGIVDRNRMKGATYLKAQVLLYV